MTRTVVLHYHLFKNAGTSLDQILRASFPGAWVTREFGEGGTDNSGQVAEWIRDTPAAVAFSSHTATGPVPVVDGTEVVSVMLLREPLARIESVYRFEQRQKADTLGAHLAKETDFEGYVRARLARRGDRQCRNFHTARLAALVPGPEPELDRAIEGLRRLTVLGLVEQFDGFVQRLGSHLAARGLSMTWRPTRANASDRTTDLEIGPELLDLLKEANREDILLLERAREILGSPAA